MYEYPKKLIDYLTKQEVEGSEIFTTKTEDGTMWIIKPNGLEQWLAIIEWYEGQDDFQLINLCGKAWERLKRTMKECDED